MQDSNTLTLLATIVCEHIRTESLILYSDHFEIAIEMGMGKDSKKKPMTKKERAEKRAQGETLEEVASSRAFFSEEDIKH